MVRLSRFSRNASERKNMSKSTIESHSSTQTPAHRSAHYLAQSDIVQDFSVWHYFSVRLSRSALAERVEVDRKNSDFCKMKYIYIYILECSDDSYYT